MSLKSSNIEQYYTVFITINNNEFVKIKQNDKYFVFEELYIKYIDFFFCAEVVHFLNRHFNYLVEYQNNNFDIINDKNNGNYKSCLMFACIEGDLNIINFLLHSGANIHEKDNLGRSCLIYACVSARVCACVCDCACVEKDLNIIDFLLRSGSNINDTDINGLNCLMIPCANGNLDLVELLLAKGANINDSDINGKNCLMYACDKGNLDIVKFLLAKGANINDTDSNGSNCLMYAIKSELYLNNTILNITKFLLAKGVNIHKMNDLNETSFSLGESMGWKSILYLLRKWPTSMGIIVLKELSLYNDHTLSIITDLYEFIGKEDFTLDNEEDYEKDADGDVINFVYESDSDDE